MFGSGNVLLQKDGTDNQILEAQNVKQIQPTIFLTRTIFSQILCMCVCLCVCVCVCVCVGHVAVFVVGHWQACIHRSVTYRRTTGGVVFDTPILFYTVAQKNRHFFVSERTQTIMTRYLQCNPEDIKFFYNVDK